MKKINLFLFGALAIARQGFASAAAEEKFPRFVAFGDAGEVDPSSQKAVANLIKDLAKKETFAAGLLLGDNFYPSGVQSVNDRRFVDNFVRIYEGLQIPFHTILGNHDYGDGGTKNMTADWQAQISFSQHESNPVIEGGKRLWNMPSSFYAVTYSDQVTVFALDTHPARMTAEQQEQVKGQSADEHEYWGMQLAWLTKALASSKTRWNIVAGHHPLVSDGKHGKDLSLYNDSESYGASLHEILCEHADLYISGHEHSIQIIKDVGCGDFSAKPLPQIISGAGGNHTLVESFKGKRAVFQAHDHGFVTLGFNDEHIEVETYFVGKPANKPTTRHYFGSRRK